jgi:hypothetical protein
MEQQFDVITIPRHGELLTEISFNHAFIVASTPSGLAWRLGREIGDAATRLLARARMMLVETFILIKEFKVSSWVVKVKFVVGSRYSNMREEGDFNSSTFRHFGSLYTNLSSVGF